MYEVCFLDTPSVLIGLRINVKLRIEKKLIFNIKAAYNLRVELG